MVLRREELEVAVVQTRTPRGILEGVVCLAAGVTQPLQHIELYIFPLKPKCWADTTLLLAYR